jgi:IS5 family transposase
LKDKRGKSQKKPRFQRDLESDWTVKNKKAFFGMKEHASIDVGSGLVLSTSVSKASDNDTKHFSYVVFKSLHGKGYSPNVYADKGYCSEANRDFLNMNGMGDGIMRKNQINATLTESEIKRNKKSPKSGTRSSSISGSPKNTMGRERPALPLSSRRAGITSAGPWPSISKEWF